MDGRDLANWAAISVLGVIVFAGAVAFCAGMLAMWIVR